MSLRALEERAREVREYVGTAQTRVLGEFLEALEDSYLQDLRECSHEQLAPIQAKLHQCEALRALLAGKPGNARV